jgi:Na+-translocating ferredoxin:NAD+ oxidoreductase RnfG subunit
MISGKNFKSIRQILTFIFLVLGIMVCSHSPLGISAFRTTNPIVHAADEMIASFDEEKESAADSKPAASVSPLLHAEHYQAPVYFPERQTQLATSRTWVRIIPFVLLVMLAFATAPFFGKRRKKNIPSGKRMTAEKILMGAMIPLIIMAITGSAQAQTSVPVKDVVVSFLGDASKIYQKDMALTPEVKKALKQKLYWEPTESSIKVYYSKTPNGAIEAYAFVLTDTLMQCEGRHKYCVKVSSKGQVEGVKVLELTCYRSFAVSNQQFLDKLKVMNTMNAEKTHIDAITGATISSKLTVMVVRRALALFELLKGSAND